MPNSRPAARVKTTTTGSSVCSLRLTVDAGVFAAIGGVESEFGVELLAEFDIFITHDEARLEHDLCRPAGQHQSQGFRAFQTGRRPRTTTTGAQELASVDESRAAEPPAP
jgi:hypothetical protein